MFVFTKKIQTFGIFKLKRDWIYETHMHLHERAVTLLFLSKLVFVIYFSMYISRVMYASWHLYQFQSFSPHLSIITNPQSFKTQTDSLTKAMCLCVGLCVQIVRITQDRQGLFWGVHFAVKPQVSSVKVKGKQEVVITLPWQSIKREEETQYKHMHVVLLGCFMSYASHCP